MSIPIVQPVTDVKINCLMGTYGRYDLVCESLACFLQQTALEEANLLIFNQHPVPLSFDHPRVRVVNEQMTNVGLRDIKKRMLELSDLSVEFTHWWDDDDLYLPWHLEDCLRHIGSHEAWKPTRSWYTPTGKNYELSYNGFEPSWILRTKSVLEAPFDSYPLYPDHPVNMHLWGQEKVARTDLGAFSSYVYRWGNGRLHISGHPLKTIDDQAEGVNRARRDERPTRNDGRLIAVDLWPRWEQFLENIKSQVTPAEYEEIYMRLSIADGLSNLGPQDAA
jgi:hypothetical protein